MENNNQLPVAELKKFGIMTEDNLFSKKLSVQEIDNFKTGSTLVADDDKNRLTFKLSEDKSSLEVNVFDKDIVNHKDLSSSELYEISITNKSLYKAVSDYGTIVEQGKTNFNHNPKNEIVSFVTVENERGKTVFYGNDLENKLKDYKIGDSVQINNVGVEKTIITANIDGELKDINKYNNLFSINPLSDENKETKSSLFQYDTKTKTIKDLDTTELDFDTINGIKLSASQIKDLKKGKEVQIDDDTIIELSPKANNFINSNTRALLISSLAFDGGMSFIIIKGLQKLNNMRLEQKRQQQTASFSTGLENMKSMLESKISQNPKDVKLQEKLKNITKEISVTNQSNTPFSKAVKEDNYNSGVLVAKGEDHYLHDKNNEKNYYVTLLGNDNKEHTIWGIDLKEKMSDIQMFENIDIKYMGKVDVIVKVPIKNEENLITGYEEKEVKRNSFDVTENNKELLQKTIDTFKESTEKLNQIKSFLLSKSRIYPEDKSIISSINIVDKYISSTNVTKRDDNKNLQVVDYDTYEDANAKKIKESIEQTEERSTSKSRSR